MKTKLYLFYFTIFSLLLCFKINAQNCNGLIKFQEDFGAGAVTGLTPGITDYSYTESGSLNRNEYRLSNTTAGNSQWHSITDHTGNADGRMMIVNADDFDGSIYCDTVYSLTPATNYNVSFYAMNLSIPGECGGGSVDPKLQLIVEIYNNSSGSYARLGSYSTDYIAETMDASWTRIEGSFQTPPNFTSVRFRLVNSSAGGCGNDFAIDDLVVTECLGRSLNSSNLAITAKKKNALVEINWLAVQQNETDVFTLQKSNNGREWKNVHTMKAEPNNDRKYTAYDTYNGWNFYRVMQTDVNGKISYSAIVRLNSSAPALYIYPNPFTSATMLEWYANEPETIIILITDAKGQCRKKMDYAVKAGFNTISITGLSSLPAGYYRVQLVNAQGKMSWNSALIKN